MGWHSFDSAAGSSSCPLPWPPNLSRRNQCPSAARAFPARLACGGITVGSYGRIQLYACGDVRRSYRAREPHIVFAAQAKRRARSRRARSLHIYRQPARDCCDVLVGISQPRTRLSLSRAEPGISGHDLGRAARPIDTAGPHPMGFSDRVSGHCLWGQAIRGRRNSAVRSGRRKSSWHRHTIRYRLRLVVRDRHVLPVPGDGRHSHRFPSADALWGMLGLTCVQALVAFNFSSKAVFSQDTAHALQDIRLAAAPDDVVAYLPSGLTERPIWGHVQESTNFSIMAMTGLEGYFSSEEYSEFAAVPRSE